MSGTLEIFDVDHGACALLSVPTWSGAQKHLLLDCGHSNNFKGERWTPGAQLIHRDIHHIDLLICTNFDEDHASGAPSLIEHGISIANILGNPTVPAAVIQQLKTEDGMGPGIEIIATSLKDRALRGVTQTVPDFPGVSIMWAWNSWPAWDTENNLSLVVHLNIGGFNFLFPGDMEKDGFENLLRNFTFAKWMGTIDVLVASHHGRANGVCEAMFDDFGCNPQLVIISDCAKTYQSQETVNYYASKCTGVRGFRQQEHRYVLTTRHDSYIRFDFEGGHRSFGGTCRVI
jgi:beta-lactamase superfamily II metal-dependent hydrolase